jgi:hypothetical protein
LDSHDGGVFHVLSDGGGVCVQFIAEEFII